MNSIQRAYKSFISRTLREARRAHERGERRYASCLRASISENLAEHRGLLSPSHPAPVDPETAKRQEQARAFASIVLTALH